MMLRQPVSQMLRAGLGVRKVCVSQGWAHFRASFLPRRACSAGGRVSGLLHRVCFSAWAGIGKEKEGLSERESEGERDEVLG